MREQRRERWNQMFGLTAKSLGHWTLGVWHLSCALAFWGTCPCRLKGKWGQGYQKLPLAMSQRHDFYLFIYSFMYLFFASQILLKIISCCMIVTFCKALCADSRMNLTHDPFEIWVCLNKKQDVTDNLRALVVPVQSSFRFLHSNPSLPEQVFCAAGRKASIPPRGWCAISLGLWLHLKKAKLFHSQDHSRIFPHRQDHMEAPPYLGRLVWP